MERAVGTLDYDRVAGMDGLPAHGEALRELRCRRQRYFDGVTRGVAHGERLALYIAHRANRSVSAAQPGNRRESASGARPGGRSPTLAVLVPSEGSEAADVVDPETWLFSTRTPT